MHVAVIGAGPAGVMAALRAADLGARVTLVTRGEFGGMAANDGPVPVRTLAHAARLLHGLRGVGRYGIHTGVPSLEYRELLARVREVVANVRDHSSLRAQADRLGVAVIEQAGTVRFTSPHTLESESGLGLEADAVIVCAGGMARRLAVPGAELTATHSDAWSLTETPASLIVVGGGMTGLQVASIFHAFGSRVQVFQRGPRILADEDEDVSLEVAKELRATGIEVLDGLDSIDGFEKCASGVRMQYSKGGRQLQADATLAVVAIGWVADTAGLNLDAAGIELDERGFIRVDAHLRTSVPHVFAAGDITGRSVLVPPAVLDAHVAATNAVTGATMTRSESAIPMGGFTDPEYAHVGVTEAEARRTGEVAVGVVRFDETARTIIDGRTTGFCKLIADRNTRRILGCHVVGERAADIVQGVALAIAGDLRVDDLARLPLAFPTYLGVVTRAAYRAARVIDPSLRVPLQDVEP